MARLGFNIFTIAVLRERSKRQVPDPVNSVVIAEIGGADGIVCPLREDLRPVSERDARLLKEIVKTHFNLQIPPVENMLSLALSIVPDMITIVPGKKPGTTQGGGLDVLGHEVTVAKIIQRIREQEIVVSVLIDPIVHQVKSAAKVGADFVEFHLGQYANTLNQNERIDRLEELTSVAAAASKLGLGVVAGRGLDYQNVQDVAAIQHVEEINIGHAIISRALWIGLEAAVRDMVALVH